MKENDNNEELNLLNEVNKKPISHEDKEEKDNLIEIFKRLEKGLVKNNNCKLEFDLNKKDDEFDKCEIFGNPECYNCSKSKKDDKQIQIFYCSHCSKLFCRECLYQHNYSDFESITDVQIKFLKTKKEIMKKRIKENVDRYFLVFIFNVVLPIMSACQLAPIFAMITIKDTLWGVIQNYFINFFRKEKKFENFYILLIKNLGTLNFDFNLMMIMNFLGDKCYKSLGFLKSSLLFYFIDLLFFLTFFNFQGGIDGDFSFLQILQLLLSYSFLFIGLGSSSLLSQKIIIESNKIYEEYLKDIEGKNEEEKKLNNDKKQMISDNINNEENIEYLEKVKIETKNLVKEKNRKMKEKGEKLKLKKNKKENKKFNSFYVISGATIIGYIFSCLMNIFLVDKYMKRIEKERNQTNLTNQLYFNDEIFIDNNKTIGNETNIKIDEINRFFVLNISVYNFHFIFWLIILYILYMKIFKKNIDKENMDIIVSNKNDLNEVNNNNSYSMCKICGYIYYSENIALKGNKSFFKMLLYFLILIFYTIIDCLDGTFCNILNTLFCGDEQKCKCCFKYNERYFNKANQHFCFFYKEKRGLKWFHDYITSEAQKEIIPYMLEYFLLKSLNLGFEKRYNEIKGEFIFDYKQNQSQKFYQGFFMIIIAFPFSLYLATVFGKSDIKKINKFQRKDSILKNINASNKILNGIHSFLLINSIISLAFSICYLFEVNIVVIDYLIVVPIIIQKSFYFVFNFYRSCISEDQKGYELIMSASMLITIYIIFWDLVIYIITILIPNNTILYIIQISLSSIIILVFIYYFIFSKLCLIIFNNNSFCNFCCYLNYSIFCIEGNCICDCCCCNIDSNCYCPYCESFYTCNCFKCCNDNNGSKYITTSNVSSSIEENLI